MTSKKIIKVITMIIAAIVIALAAFGFMIYKSSQPLPEKDRIVGAQMKDGDKLTMQVSLKSINDSTAITRTYLAKDYNDLSEKKKQKASRYVVGNVEGDMPTVSMKKGEVFRPYFFIGERQVTPDSAPKVQGEIYTGAVIPPKPDQIDSTTRVIKFRGDFKSDDDGYYLDVLDFAKAKELDNINSAIIKLEYEYKGEKYISLTAVNLDVV